MYLFHWEDNPVAAASSVIGWRILNITFSKVYAWSSQTRSFSLIYLCRCH